MHALSMSIGNFSLLKWLIVIMVMMPQTITDIKKKKIILSLTAVCMAAGVAIRLYEGELWKPETALCLLPGILVIALAYISQGGIGHGDGLLILSLGMLLGITGLIQLLTISLIAAGLFSLVLLITGKAGKKTAIPFVPFLFAGTVTAGLI